MADLVQSVLDGLSSHVNVNEYELLQRDIADSSAYLKMKVGLLL